MNDRVKTRAGKKLIVPFVSLLKWPHPLWFWIVLFTHSLTTLSRWEVNASSSQSGFFHHHLWPETEKAKWDDPCKVRELKVPGRWLGLFFPTSLSAPWVVPCSVGWMLVRCSLLSGIGRRLVETRKYLPEGEYFTEKALDKKVKTEFLFEILG